MSEKLFDVIFSGIIQGSKDKYAVMHNMAKLFKTEVSKLAPLFTGGRKVVKRRVNYATAKRFVKALESIGLLVKIEPTSVTRTPIKKTAVSAHTNVNSNKGKKQAHQPPQVQPSPRVLPKNNTTRVSSGQASPTQLPQKPAVNKPLGHTQSADATPPNHSRNVTIPAHKRTIPADIGKAPITSPSSELFNESRLSPPIPPSDKPVITPSNKPVTRPDEHVGQLHKPITAPVLTKPETFHRLKPNNSAKTRVINHSTEQQVQTLKNTKVRQNAARRAANEKSAIEKIVGSNTVAVKPVEKSRYGSAAVAASAVATQKIKANLSKIATLIANQVDDSISTGHLTLARIGANMLSQSPVVKKQKIADFSHLTMANVGSALVVNSVKPTPQTIANFDHLTLAKVGSDILSQPRPTPPPASIDISHLSTA